MSERVYEVTEEVRLFSTGHVRARSMAEAVEILKRGEAGELIHSEAEPVRWTARRLSAEEARRA